MANEEINMDPGSSRAVLGDLLRFNHAGECFFLLYSSIVELYHAASSLLNIKRRLSFLAFDFGFLEAPLGFF